MTEGKTLYQVLQDIFSKYGYHSETLKNIVLTGLEGKRRIDRIMEHFTKYHLERVAEKDVVWIEDYYQKLRFRGQEQETAVVAAFRGRQIHASRRFLVRSSAFGN